MALLLQFGTTHIRRKPNRGTEPQDIGNYAPE